MTDLPTPSDRPRLSRLLADTSAPITLMLAAIGYGKTTAARLWWESLPSPKAWCGLGSRAPNIDEFRAAARIAWGLDAEDMRPAADHQPTLLRLQAGYLVLDNCPSSPCELLDDLRDWAELLPAGCHLILVCDQLPPLPLSRWHNEKRLNIISQSQLALSAEEWDAQDPQTWTQTLVRGIDYLLAEQRWAEAAQLALESGLGEQQDRVLTRCGWLLLYNPLRPVLGKLIAQPYFYLSNTQHQSRQLLQLAWQIEVDKQPHLADAALQTLLPSLTEHNRGAALALSASIAWQYDHHDRALADARAALAAFPNDLHPAYTLALVLLGSALMTKGQVNAAEPWLHKAQAYAARDHLGYLQLDVLQRRALLATEMNRLAAAQQLVGQIQQQATALGLEQAGILDSSSRLQAWIHLQQGQYQAIPNALERGHSIAQALGQRWDFPRQWYAGILALIHHDRLAARSALDNISQHLESQFCPYKWQNEAVLFILWFAAQTHDKNCLALWIQKLEQCDWLPSLHRQRRRVLLAAARLLAGAPEDANELAVLKDDLHQQGALALEEQLGIIMALATQNLNQFKQHLALSAINNAVFDYVWLGSKSVAPLQSLVTAAELAAQEGTLRFTKELLARLLSPTAGSSNAEHAKATISQPPAGLTPKEWEVLQLIGQRLSNEQIAARLFVSLATIKTHINHIYGKLAIKTRSEAIHCAHNLQG